MPTRLTRVEFLDTTTGAAFRVRPRRRLRVRLGLLLAVLLLTAFAAALATEVLGRFGWTPPFE